jgi:hypothetical protein
MTKKEFGISHTTRCRMVGLPVPAQRQIEGRQRPTELSDRETDHHHDAFEVDAGRPGEVDAHRQNPSGGPGRLRPLDGPLLAGEGGFELAGQRRLADPSDPVEDDHIPAG